ncbi:MAG: FdtA/QdtA family cupin domain-containing protein [Fusobacteria bacterium]|nr:FdtA/QdtA family cupin domain-containing protein [Fusobacteriota bacterium]
MKYRLVELKVNDDHRGSLVALEGNKEIPFAIKRVFYIYGNKELQPRAGHANHNNELFLICLNGSCRITVDDGRNREKYILCQPQQGLYVDSNVWVEIDGFTSSCVLLALASKAYTEEDYIEDYEEFKRIVR